VHPVAIGKEPEEVVPRPRSEFGKKDLLCRFCLATFRPPSSITWHSRIFRFAKPQDGRPETAVTAQQNKHFSNKLNTLPEAPRAKGLYTLHPPAKLKSRDAAHSSEPASH